MMCVATSCGCSGLHSGLSKHVCYIDFQRCTLVFTCGFVNIAIGGNNKGHLFSATNATVNTPETEHNYLINW